MNRSISVFEKQIERESSGEVIQVYPGRKQQGPASQLAVV